MVLQLQNLEIPARPIQTRGWKLKARTQETRIEKIQVLAKIQWKRLTSKIKQKTLEEIDNPLTQQNHLNQKIENTTTIAKNMLPSLVIP